MYIHTYIYTHIIYIYTHHIYIYMILSTRIVISITDDAGQCCHCYHCRRQTKVPLQPFRAISTPWSCQLGLFPTAHGLWDFGTLGLWDWNAWRKGDSNYKLWDFMDIWCSIPRVLANPGVCPWFLSMFLQSFSAPNIQPPMAGGDRIASATSDQELGEDHDRCLGWCHAQCRVANCGFNKSYVFHHL